MSKRILIAVAWPYSNGSLHLGQVAGAYLPPDIFARFHRMNGNEVLMVSGSDAHGTPVTLKAEQLGTTPEEISSGYQAEFLDNWKRLGISFDLFTSTHTQNHTEVVQNIFQDLYKKGYIYRDTMTQPYCETDRRFLADRYVEGICPYCNTERARGDQCDQCGRTLDPQDLIDMVCKICATTPVIKETEHFFLKLSAFEGPLLDWARTQNHWRPNVRNFTVSFLKGGLHDRAITRDIEWGVPVPIKGFESKRIYVWFEAVIGYLSATKEWSKIKGSPNRWTDYWQKECKSYYFVGKDNIPFHTIIWPAMLMGYGGLNLPYDVPANEYLNLDGLKFSTSRNWAVWLPEYLDKYEPDPLRYVLAASMPETSDSDFSWKEYLRRNNDELVATYGNLVHRALTLTHRNFDGEIPHHGTIDDLSIHLIEQAHQHFKMTGVNLESCRFRLALQSAMTLAQAANRFLDQKAPWQAVKTDLDGAGSTLWVVLTVVNCLKTLFYPFLPFSSEKLHQMLGFKGNIQDTGWKWDPNDLKPGQKLADPKPLFTKLDESLLEQEMQQINS